MIFYFFSGYLLLAMAYLTIGSLSNFNGSGGTVTNFGAINTLLVMMQTLTQYWLGLNETPRIPTVT